MRKLEGELGVRVLDRGPSGTTTTEDGHLLLPHVLEVLEAVDRLRRAAGAHHPRARVVSVGTVTAATAPLLSPTIRAFRDANAGAQVEVVTAQQEEIHRELRGGGLDLGLVNYLDDEPLPADLESTELLRGRPVVCVGVDSPLAAKESVCAADLAGESLIGMRSGYVMHRYVERLFGGESPSYSYSADGAEMGKLMVAEGLGAAVLPDYSVAGDPLEQRGAITYRPLEGAETTVLLAIQRRGPSDAPGLAPQLHELFVDRAREFMLARAAA